MCVFIYIYIQISIPISMHAWIHVHVFMYVRMYVFVYACIREKFRASVGWISTFGIISASFWVFAKNYLQYEFNI